MGEERIKGVRGGERKQRGVKRKSGAVGRTKWKECWQESGTATQLCFGVGGPPRLVSLYFIVREKTGSETLETL